MSTLSSSVALFLQTVRLYSTWIWLILNPKNNLLTDTHTHLYLPEFDQDREVAMERAFGQGIERIFLPNIDADSIATMLALCGQYQEHCFPMLGLDRKSTRMNSSHQ